MTIPALFVSHGSPMVAVELDPYTDALTAFGQRYPEPKGIVVISAHWETQGPVRVTTGADYKTIHDFGGFPEELYRLHYPAAGDPALAEKILALLTAGEIPCEADPRRGLDHGVWVPLRYLYPQANIPVVCVSLPVPRKPEAMLRVGEILRPLRGEGVMILGSGGLVHNLSRVNFGEKYAPVDVWAKRFDQWIGEQIAAKNIEGIRHYETEGPTPRIAVPTTEHFDPVFPVLGARLPGDRVNTFFEGFHHGNLSMRCFALES